MPALPTVSKTQSSAEAVTAAAIPEDSANNGYAAALAMLDLFVSVGATGFNVTWTTIADQPRRSHKGMSSAEITRSMPGVLDAAPLNREGTGPDRSNADLRWCMLAISWGFGVKETAARYVAERQQSAHRRA